VEELLILNHVHMNKILLLNVKEMEILPVNLKKKDKVKFLILLVLDIYPYLLLYQLIVLLKEMNLC
jgi:hypothetical protein